MRNLLTIFRRELSAYFNSPIGAIFLIVFSLIASGLFVTEFFLFPVAELRSFFNVLPFILCVFIPAVTMRLWAEDRSANTVEMLLTFPMNPMALVLGKYMAGLVFFILALFSTGMLALMVMALGRPDLGQLASSYLGGLLLGGCFLALGQLVSGFAKDQIVAFVLSLLACFALFLLGTNFAATALDAWINGLGTLLREYLGATGHYTTFTRGIIELSDLAYFVVWTALFLFLNGLHIEGRGRRNFGSLFALSTALCLGIGLAFNGLVGDVSLGRYDWTEGKIHTISEASKRILADLKVPVQVSYYVTPEEDMPTEIKTMERDVLDRLEELRLASHGMLAYKRVYMHAANVVGGNPFDQKKEPADAMEKRMLEKGIEPFSVAAMRQTGSVSDLIYSSIGVAYKDAPEEIIPRIVPESLGELEYSLVSTVFRLAKQTKPTVTLVADTAQFSLLQQMLTQEKYQVRPSMLSAQSPLAESDVLLVMQPMNLSERQRWELSRALASGQKTIMAIQDSQWDYNMAQGNISVQRIPMETGIEPLLDSLGVSLEKKTLMDTQSTAIRVARNQVDQMFGGGMNLKLPTQIVLTRDNMNQSDPLTARLENVFYLWGSAFALQQETLGKLGLNATVLLSSSPTSWLVETGPTLSQNNIMPPANGTASYPAVIRVSGQFPAPAAPAPAWEDSGNATVEENKRPNAPSQLLLIGGAAMFNNDMLQNNAELMMNAVDFLAYGPELIQIRGKKMQNRVIMDMHPEAATLWKILAYCLPTLCIAGLAASRAWTRTRRRALYAQHVRSAA